MVRRFALRHHIAHARIAQPRRHAVRPGRVIILGFLAVILLGAALLHLPVAARDGIMTPFVDCLFTATSATCVTGLVVVDTYTHWTVFGQIVILGLIQIGGLGIMTVAALVSFFTRRTITMRERMEMSASLSVDDIAGIVRLTRGVLLFTLAMEGTGAVCLAFRFIPQFGLWDGIGKSIFHAISAFCNAGFDLMGEIEPYSNLSSYAADPLVNIVIVTLIVVGGLGFLVWRDITKRRDWVHLSVHSKLVLSTTAILIFGGAALFFCSEYFNSNTMGDMPLYERIMASIFQSVTCRTAGFNTIDQGSLTGSSTIVGSLLMFIGGSPGSTAGGIKTTSAALLALSAWSVMHGKQEITVFRRRVSNRTVLNALALALVAALLIFIGVFILCAADGVSVGRALFETASAFSTTGLSQNLTPTLGTISKLWLILEMYLGRVGILTLGVAVLTRHVREPKIRYPEGQVMVG